MLSTHLISVLSEMLQHVSTSEGNIQASDVKYIKGVIYIIITIVYIYIYFRSCIVYRWSERDPMKSKRVLVVWATIYFPYFKSNTMVQQKFFEELLTYT
jgi:hypothetical protein